MTITGRWRGSPKGLSTPEVFHKFDEMFLSPTMDVTRMSQALLDGSTGALDLTVSVDVPGCHGHNYHGVFLPYWEVLLGSQAGTPVQLTPEIQRTAIMWIRENSVRR